MNYTTIFCVLFIQNFLFDVVISIKCAFELTNDYKVQKRKDFPFSTGMHSYDEMYDDVGIEPSTCARADFCYVAVYESYVRRGCVRGFKYYPTSGCFHDPSFFDKTEMRMNDSSATICFCNTTKCNAANPVITSKSGTVAVTLNNKSLPVTVRKPISCYSYTKHEQINSSKPTWAQLSKLTFSNKPRTMSLGAGCFMKMSFRRVPDSVTADTVADAQYQREAPSASFANMGARLFHFMDYNTGMPPYYPGLLVFTQTDNYPPTGHFFCDTPNCNNIQNLASFNTTPKITCIASEPDDSSDGPTTCTGDLCFYMRYRPSGKIYRGCITQDNSRAQGRIEVGKMVFTANYVICAEASCNKNYKTAMKSAKNYKPEQSPFVPFKA